MESRDGRTNDSLSEDGMIMVDGAPWGIKRCVDCKIIPDTIKDSEGLFYVDCNCKPTLKSLNKVTAVISWNDKQRHRKMIKRDL